MAACGTPENDMTSTHQNGAITIRASKSWLLLFAFLLLIPWGFFLLVGTRIRQHTHESDSQPQTEKSGPYQIQATPGPWGDLKIVRVTIEPPWEILSPFLEHPQPVWRFIGYSRSQFSELLAHAGLTDAQRATLESAAVWQPDGAGCAIVPSPELLWSLTPESRAKLYGALSLFRENVYQHEPFRFPIELADEWLSNTGLPEAILAQTRRLFYRRGKTLLFSDPHLILPTLASDRDRIRLLKALTRQSTLLVNLHVDASADIPSLVNYWTAGYPGRAKDIRPLLNSATRVPGGLDIDISHLLPRFASKRLYTYPNADLDGQSMFFDCHWNSMNFWNDPPDDRFADSAFVIQTLETEYEVVLNDFSFGDILLFMRSATQAIHSAVYVADQIVFTKNGPGPYSPWILMRLDTLVSHYETNMDVEVRGYRRIQRPAMATL